MLRPKGNGEGEGNGKGETSRKLGMRSGRLGREKNVRTRDG